MSELTKKLLEAFDELEDVEFTDYNLLLDAAATLGQQDVYITALESAIREIDKAACKIDGRPLQEQSRKIGELLEKTTDAYELLDEDEFPVQSAIDEVNKR